jgi:hypothetical protein
VAFTETQLAFQRGRRFSLSRPTGEGRGEGNPPMTARRPDPHSQPALTGAGGGKDVLQPGFKSFHDLLKASERDALLTLFQAMQS